MKTSESQKQAWSTDFQEFLATSEKAPPKHVSTRVINHVHESLNPSGISVFGKIAAIHSIIGSVTLLFCPYSEFYTFENFNIMHVLMKFGELACMTGCGAFYLGTSMLTASILLRPEEIQAIRKARFLQISILTALSTAISVCTGLLFLENLVMLWALGSLLGGLLTLELGWALRKWVRSLSFS